MSDPLIALRRRCDAALERCLPAMSDTGPVAQAMRYAVTGGGKRVRPLLVYAAGQTLGASVESLDPAACAIELIHAYSLVHDDLPAMDDDDLRRGRPTVHRAFDEASAILAGDALQTLAFEVITGGVEVGLPAAAVLAQCRELARAAGIAGMVGGQALDLALVGSQPDLDLLQQMHQLKTGALITAAVRLGVLAAGTVDAEHATALDRYARDLGLAFQIQDDVLDEVGDSAITGKAVGADRERGKPTYTALLGVEPARGRAEALLASALDALAGIPRDTRLLTTVAARLVRRVR
ncbi:MAG: polyprenyl synthetase family protein [Xanthomonadales bacterium]|nr:polyprenyl synthetase family protein [Xanthomonadales bacterium]